MYRKPDKFLQDIINNWQSCKFTKSIYDNAVTEVLDSLSAKSNAKIKNDFVNATPVASQDFKLENEAVLMAIERKGLRQQDAECYCSSEEMQDDTDYALPRGPNYQFTLDNKHDFYVRNNEFDDSFSRNDENQESNFENNFMRTAVSAAIEQKGLGICRV